MEETSSDDDEDGASASASASESESEEEVAFKVHEHAAAGTTKKKNGKFIVHAKRKKIPSLESTHSSRKQTLPFYVAPVKRYYYWTPKALIAARREASNKTENAVGAESGKARRKKHHIGRLGERTSPFLSFWYCGMGDQLQLEALRWHRKLPRAAVMGYTVATHPNDLPPAVLDEWDPRRQAAAAEAAAESGGSVHRPKRYAGFSGANCGQNMSAKYKKRYKEFDDTGDTFKGKTKAKGPRDGGGKGDGGGRGGRGGGANWGNGKGGDGKEGSMFQRPRKKRKY